MGIFSLFGKKDRRQEKPADKTGSRSKRSAPATPDSSRTASTRTPAKRDAQAALATALKIDAIESEMSSEFRNTTLTRATQPPSAPAPSKPAPPAPAPAPARNKPSAPAPEKPRAEAKKPAKQPLPDLRSSTEFLLNGSSTIGSVALAPSEVAAVVEEAAIMFANNQVELVEQMLQAAIEEDLLGEALLEVWLMLFDLYQITGKQMEHENLSIAYASRFETSPPSWMCATQAAPKPAAAPSGATPAVPFSGKLDAASIKHIERARKLAETHRALRLEFARITEVDAAGCGLLLQLLKTLQKSGHELVLVGAPELAEKIRATLEVGRRDETEDGWLLLLEILQLLNREKEFEEISIDYCVTFEVSPPAFIAPKKVTTAAVEATPAAATPAEIFLMPAVVEGRIDNLILAIAAYSDEHSPAIIDCSGLERVDFNAAGRLMTGLAPFCGNGKVIEFHHVNHLVAALLNVIGLKDIVRIVVRKN